MNYDDTPPLDAFSHHEILHTAMLAADLFERHLLDHRAVQADPALHAMAQAISDQMWDFYQAIGARTLPSPTPSPLRRQGPS